MYKHFVESWIYFKGYRHLVLVSLFIKIFKSVVNIFIPLVYSFIIFNLMLYKKNLIIKGILVLIICYVTIIIMNYLSNKLDIIAKMRVGIHVRKLVMKEILAIPNSSLLDYSSGKLYSLIESDFNAVSNFVYSIINSLLHIFTIIGIGTVIFVINWKLALIIVVTYPIAIKINTIYKRKIKSSSKDLIIKNDSIISFMKNTFLNISDIKAQDGSEIITNEFNNKIDTITETSIKRSYFQLNYSTIISVISFLNNMLFTIFGIMFVLSKQLLLSNFIAFNSYAKSFKSSLDSIVQLSANLQPSVVSLERLRGFNELYKSVNEKERVKVEIDDIRNMRLSNVSLSINGKEILKGINLFCEKSEIIGISGLNGSGKTSIANLLLYNYLPCKGNIYLNEMDIQDIKYKSLKNAISYIGPNKILYSISILKNILLFNHENSIDFEDVKRICDVVNILKDINELPINFETIISDSVSLSSGQIQKIQIARVLLKNSPIIILDEALSNLDTQTKQKVKKYIKEISPNKIIIVFAHNNEDYNICNKVFSLHKGKLSLINNN